MSHTFGNDDTFSSDETAPTEAWLFARLIRGEYIPPIIHPEARARAKREELERLARFSSSHAEELSRIKIAEADTLRERESLEWAARISTRAEEKLQTLQQQEAEEREAWRRTEAFYERYVANVTEWNPDQPRAPAGSPQGGQWTKGGGGGPSAGGPPSHPNLATQHNRGFADHTSEPAASTGTSAKTAQFTGDHAPVHLAAAASAVGHHWVPKAVFNALSHLMDSDALKVFQLGTESTGVYDHGFDTWNGVKHKGYSEAMAKLLKDWIAKKGGKLDADGARTFLSWIASGECGDDAFLAKHKALFDTVFKWRAGFNKSIVVAAAAAEIDPKLTAAELKAIAQQVVNRAPTKPLSKAAAKALQDVVAGGKALLKRVANKVLPGFMFLSAAMAAKRGWAGEGRYGDGAWGAGSEVLRDLVCADTVEQIVFPKVIDTVDGLVNLAVPGLNDPGKNRYLRRGGHVYDMQTGRQID